MKAFIAWRCVQDWASIAASPKVGDRSSAIAIVKVRVAGSPSASVAFHVYVVEDWCPLGVPLTRWLPFLTTPLGSAGLIE